MNIVSLIHIIKEEHYVDLNKWQKNFIDDLYIGVDGLYTGMSDEEASEYLTQKQINKVREIGEELGI